jgi:hypothetical protein
MKNWKGFLYGITYGLVARGLFALELSDDAWLPTYGMMTLTFMFIVPLVVGVITAYHFDNVTRATKIVVITMPLFSMIGVVLVSLLMGWEGIICALMAIPIFAIMSLIGGFIGVTVFKRRKDKMLVSLFVFLPFLIAPIENYFGLSDKIFYEQTEILINSSEDKVWQNITRVKRISDRENKVSLFQLMGFPRPIEAELDTVMVGGIRKAIFDRGLYFTETVTEMIPNRVLAFTIKADPNSTPPTALDEHVMVGGKYFDIMDGKYELEKISDVQIKLHLTSRFRLSTHFNFYSGLWSKLIMRDLQENILEIIKTRCEREHERA